MPANLTPFYRKAEQRYKQASTPQEELDGLQEMLRELPKHKGTEKIQADLKKRISEVKERLKKAPKAGGKGGFSTKVDRQGLFQVALVGPPNGGRSSLLAALTGAHPEIAAYPFTTRVPQPGVAVFDKYRLQLVDLPAVSTAHMEPWVPSSIRAADAALLILDLSDDGLLETAVETLDFLDTKRVRLVRDVDDEEEQIAPVPTLCVGNKADDPDAETRQALLDELWGGRFPILPVSAESGLGLDALRRQLVDFLGVIRVYTKKPGGAMDLEEPFIIRRGDTVSDLAERIHRDIAAKLKSVRQFRPDGSGGQWVSRDYVLEDEDVVEIEL